MTETLVNKVAQSGIVTLNLEPHYIEGERVFIDIKEVLFMGLVLKEKDFRTWVKEHDWQQYANKHVAIGCSADAIIPTWAYMLMSNQLASVASTIYFGNLDGLENYLWAQELSKIDWQNYADAKVVIKGCSDKEVVPFAYVYATQQLTPVAQSIMFGEPCSTVPVYKRKKSQD